MHPHLLAQHHSSLVHEYAQYTPDPRTSQIHVNYTTRAAKVNTEVYVLFLSAHPAVSWNGNRWQK
jgi:hypothetical protein